MNNQFFTIRLSCIKFGTHIKQAKTKRNCSCKFFIRLIIRVHKRKLLV